MRAIASIIVYATMLVGVTCMGIAIVQASIGYREKQREAKARKALSRARDKAKAVLVAFMAADSLSQTGTPIRAEQWISLYRAIGDLTLLLAGGHQRGLPGWHDGEHDFRPGKRGI